MRDILRRVYGIFVWLIVIVQTFFSTGKLPTAQLPVKQPGEYTSYVDVFTGTGGYTWMSGNTSPGATVPFGAVNIAPDTCEPGGVSVFASGYSGYFYMNSFIQGFSHTRLSGTGARDLGHFRVTPALGCADPAKRLTSPLAFTHDRESASPGYYSVYLPNVSCFAEMTAAEHSGIHRYTFSTERDAHLFIDCTSFLSGYRADSGKVSINAAANEITGQGTVYTSFAGRYGGLTAYFAASFNTPFRSFTTWSEGRQSEEAENTGTDCGANINFGNVNGNPVEMRIGISFVSLENARENLEAEALMIGFDDMRAAADGVWNSYLSRIKIESEDEEIKTVFYTALYHSMVMPTSFTDVNGEYLGFDGRVSTAEGYTYRTNMSLWDTCRTTHPLYTLVAPEIQNDCLKSLVEMTKAGGVVPRWPSGAGYTGSMFGSPAVIMIAESYLKGFRDFDVQTLYNSLVYTSDNEVNGVPGRVNVNAYNTLGYCAADVKDKSVSCTLEYCWEDSAIASLAAALGNEEDAQRFALKSKNYVNIFNNDTKYFQGRNSDGSWVEPLKTESISFYDDIFGTSYSKAYCEGGARQWRWFVPQDAQGLISLMGRDYFVSELENFMEDASLNSGAVNPGPGYWIGNEHDIHAPYMFIEAGRADLTQKWVRWTLANRFGSAPDGLDGNDDCGTLSSWYVFSALGFYPLAGTDSYWIGSPNINSAKISLGNGNTLNIIANNQSPENIYVKSVKLNGQQLDSVKVTHGQLMSGGTLEFTMGK